MLGDALEHVPQIPVRIDVVEVRGGDQRVDVRRPLAAGVGAGEQIVAPTEDQRPDRTLGAVVVDLDAAIVAIAGQRRWAAIAAQKIRGYDKGYFNSCLSSYAPRFGVPWGRQINH
jgi:hypothetical protein